MTDWKQMKTVQWLRVDRNNKYEGFIHMGGYTWANSVGVFRRIYQGKKAVLYHVQEQGGRRWNQWHILERDQRIDFVVGDRKWE